MSQLEISANKKIARNTLMLYFRMLFSMLVTLYTSRVILNVLGAEDFGIYNVVGGVIIMLGFLNSAMAASTQRFLTYEIGKNDQSQLVKVFRMSVTIHIGIAVLVFIIAETLGLWFINNKLVIPESRMNAAQWVYQFSVFSFIVTVLSVPYNALIIAHERMKTFALVGILEVLLKLGIVFLLTAFAMDKLILYAFLLFLIALIIRVVYGVYCSLHFQECKNYHFFWDKELFNSLGSFAGWNLLGVAAGIAYNQGINILLNIFFGPVVNAARGIAFQVQSAVNSFVSNFQVAVNPSITKYYSKGESEASFKLVFTSSKFSYFLLLLLSMPLILETELILYWWLKKVPDFTIIFTRLVLLDILIGSISGALQSVAQASGKIRKYQLIVSGILLLNLPISFAFLKLGYSPEYTMFVSIACSILALFGRLYILKKEIDFPIVDFTLSVLLQILLITTVSCIVGFALQMYIPESGWKFYIVSVLSSLTTIIAVIMLGLNQQERLVVKNNVSKLLSKLNL